MTAKGWGVLLGGNENVLKLIIVMASQLCEYMKSYWIIHFILVNCMLCELHLNHRAVLKKTTHPHSLSQKSVEFSSIDKKG